MLKRKGVAELSLFSLSFLILFYFYHEVIMHPNDYLFSAWGDGVKNYYSYVYHAKYDSSFWEFSGMNYPYYEHIVYTDGHPLLSWIIGKLWLTEYAVGILNMCMMLAYPLCSLILYKILRHYQVSINWSIAASIAITFLSPQIFRLTGHFSLSYVFAVPGMWYVLIRSNQSKPWLWIVIGFLYIFSFFFTHPYLGLILGSFGFTFWIINAIIMKAWKLKMLSLIIQVVLPIILFQGLVLLTDTHIDRTGEPQGFYDFGASWASLFVPHHGPMNHVKLWLHLRTNHWEILAYIGFGTIVLCAIILGFVINQWKNINFKSIVKKELFIFFLAAWFVLVFSFCFPFKFSFMHWLADVFRPLKQFRVLGRFSWIFFYIITVTVVIYFYRITLLKKKKIGLTVLFFCAMLFHLVEAKPAHEEVAIAISESKNAFKLENLEPKLKELISFIDISDYDALMILPFQHMSSENIMLLGTEEANFDAFMLSYHCHKPLLNSVSSRMSITEAIEFNNFLAPEYIEKKLINDFPTNDKILIIKTQGNVKDGGMRLIFSSTEVFNNSEYIAFEFEPERYNTSYYFDQIVAAEKKAVHEQLYGFKSDSLYKFFLYESFDDDKGVSLGGEGAFHTRKEGTNVLYELTGEIPEGSYTVSFWHYLGVDAPTMLALVDQDYGGSQESEWVDQFDVKQSTLIVDHWCRVELHFEWTKETEKVTVFLSGSGNKAPLYVDELMIYDNGPGTLIKRVESKGVEYIVYNNEWIRADSFSKEDP